MPLFFSVQAQLKANFTADVTSGCDFVVAQFTDVSTGNPTQWFWDLGNGIITTQKNPKSFYFTPGVYSVKLVVRNANGVDSIVKNNFITVNALPNVNFVASDTTGCFPLRVRFSDLSAPGTGTITSWEWDFGDGTFSREQNPTHTYQVAGNFTITLKVTNSAGCTKVLPKPNYIKIQSGVKAGFTYSTAQACRPPVTIQFQDTSRGASINSFLWDFGDGSTSTDRSPAHSYINTGSYTVRLVVRNASGCVDTAVKQNAIVVGTVKADFTNPNSVCQGAFVSFANSSNPAASSVTWNFGDGTTSTSINPGKIYSSSGTFAVKLVANFGSCQDSVTKTINVLPKPSADFTLSGTTARCAPPITVNFSNNSPGITSYLWSFGDGATSTSPNPSHTYTTIGNYAAALIATAANGCKDTVTKPNGIRVTPPDIISINGAPFSGCAPYTERFFANINSPEAVAGYLWNFGDGGTSTLPDPTYTYGKEGSFTISLIVTTVNGCTDTLTLNDAIKLFTKPKANFTATPRETCAFTPIQFTDASTGTVTQWLWTFGDGRSSTAQNPQYPYIDTGYFNVKLEVRNNNCVDTVNFPRFVYIKPPIAHFTTSISCDTPLLRRFQDYSQGATSWKWEFGDGATSNLPSPSHIYSSPGTYVVKLEVSNGECVHQTMDTLTLIDESPGITISDTILCKNTNIVFTATNVNLTNIVSYTWLFGDGGVTTTSVPGISYAYPNAGRYSVVLITTNVQGCTDTATSSANIRILGPKANFTNPGGTCLGQILSFTDQTTIDSVFTIKEWIWDFGDTVVQRYTAPPFQHLYNYPGTFDVKLKVIDVNGCIDSIVKPQAVIITKPKASFSVDSVRCTNNGARFKNESAGLDLIYRWDFGDGTTSATASPVHAYTTEGRYTIKLVIQDRFGCTDSMIAVNAVLIANPKAAFTLKDSTSSCPPFILNATSSSANYSSVRWEFGDGSFANIENPSHYYNYAGNYSLKLVAYGFGDCADSASRTIVIKGPSGNLEYDSTPKCKPANVTFKGTTLNNASFVWEFGDGSTLTTTDSVVTHTYDRPGVYRPRMLLIDVAGCRVPISGPSDVVIADVRAGIADFQKTFCDSALINFRDSSSGINDRVSSYLWNFGDGNTSTAANPRHFYMSSGRYNVSLIVSTSFDCKDTAMLQFPVKIIQSPLISISGPAIGCINDSLVYRGNFLRNDTSVVKWVWNFGNGNTASVQNPLAQSYSQAGSPGITAIATNSSTCADTVVYPITIHSLPNVDAGPDSIICRGDRIILRATGAASYTWASSPSLSCINCTSPTANPPDTLVKYFVTGTSSVGCVNTDSVTVKVFQPFRLAVTSADTLCEGQSLNLLASGTDLYSWTPSVSLSNASIANPVARPNTTTNYRVVGTDVLGCFSDTAYVLVSVFPIPRFNIVQDNLTLAVGSSIPLTTTNSPDIIKWRWIPFQALNCTDCANPVASPKSTVTIKAEAFNAGGCQAEDQLTITVICSSGNFYIPNTFSPNGDGQNDYFYPRGKGIAGIRSFTIYNRWGAVVYQKNNFSPNDEKAGWNGTYNGQVLDPDVFVYFVEVICENNQIFPVKGNVTLIK